MKVIKVTEDTANAEYSFPENEDLPSGKRVTLEDDDGRFFTVNIPESRWGDGKHPYGLNLVFDHSGEGDHYE